MQRTRNGKQIDKNKVQEEKNKSKKISHKKKVKSNFDSKRFERKPKSKVRTYDPRGSKFVHDVSTDQAMDNANPSVVINAHINPSSMSGVAVAVVSYALNRGYNMYAEKPQYPFYASVYLTQVLINRMLNITDQSHDLPYWLVCIADAYSPKVVKSQAGNISYTFEVPQTDSDNVLGVTSQIGPQAYGLRWNTGVITPSVVNTDFHTIDVTTTYNETEGKKAFSSLMQFLSNPTHKRSNMHKLVPVSTVTRFLKDPSAFCTTNATPGGGYFDSGAFLTQLQLEVPIRTPLLAGLCPGGDSLYTPGRFPVFSRAFAGDAIFTGGSFAFLLNDRELHTKKTPIFHCVDFNEFVDTMALVLVKAATNFVNDGENVALLSQPPDVVRKIVQCPLTFQEFMICLRATLMTAFADTQYAVQGIYPCHVSSSSDNQFAAFACGMGTCSLPNQNGMHLPQVLVENIRALTYRKNSGHRGGDKDVQLYVPILGQYNGDSLVSSDYFVTYQTGTGEPSTVTVPIFATGVEFEHRSVDQFGKSVSKLSAETPIRMIDGLAGNTYIAINDPGAVNKLVTAWNSYINGLSSYLYTLTTIGTDSGISSLFMGIFTRYWAPAVQPLKKDKRFRSLDLSSIYSQKQIMSYSTSEIPLKANWETIQSAWIAPTMKINPSGEPRTDTGFQRMSAGLRENIQLPTVQSETAYTLAEGHSLCASFCVKTKTGKNTDINDFLVEQSRLGRGGILSSLAASFVPALAGIAQQAITSIPY